MHRGRGRSDEALLDVLRPSFPKAEDVPQNEGGSLIIREQTQMESRHLTHHYLRKATKVLAHNTKGMKTPVLTWPESGSLPKHVHKRLRTYTTQA